MKTKKLLSSMLTPKTIAAAITQNEFKESLRSAAIEAGIPESLTLWDTCRSMTLDQLAAFLAPQGIRFAGKKENGQSYRNFKGEELLEAVKLLEKQKLI